MVNDEAATCACAGLQIGVYRAYEMPPDCTRSFAMDTDHNYPWESIHKCSVCGQYWHQDTYSSHANYETWEKITPRQRKVLLKRFSDATSR
jgi:hypothetical protein